MYNLNFDFSVHGLYCYDCSSNKLEHCSTLHEIDELPIKLCRFDNAFCFTRVAGKIQLVKCGVN